MCGSLQCQGKRTKFAPKLHANSYYGNALTKSSSFLQNNFQPDDWISQAEAASLRGVSRQAIHQLVQKGRFRTYDVAGRTLVLREDVVRYEPDKGGRPSTTDEAEKKEEQKA